MKNLNKKRKKLKNKKLKNKNLKLRLNNNQKRIMIKLYKINKFILKSKIYLINVNIIQMKL